MPWLNKLKKTVSTLRVKKRGVCFEAAHATQNVSITRALPYGTVHVPVPKRPLPSPHLYSWWAYWYSHASAERLWRGKIFVLESLILVSMSTLWGTDAVLAGGRTVTRTVPVPGTARESSWWLASKQTPPIFDPRTLNPVFQSLKSQDPLNQPIKISTIVCAVMTVRMIE